jgi:hypothetical protein
MTNEQLKTVNEFRAALDTQIINYLTWGSSRCLNVIYFEDGDNVFLQAVVPNGISNDDAGMFVARHNFRIEKDGNYFEITSANYQATKKLAKEVISSNPNA